MPQCPESGAEHEYDAGLCIHCDAPEPEPEADETPSDPEPDAFLEAAYEDRISMAEASYPGSDGDFSW